MPRDSIPEAAALVAIPSYLLRLYDGRSSHRDTSPFASIVDGNKFRIVWRNSGLWSFMVRVTDELAIA